jgi:aminoglycoside 2'-N-acetyltransferase I
MLSKALAVGVRIIKDAGMMRIRVAHTADVEPAVLDDARRLLDEAFDGDMSEEDWRHCLGGVHALAFDGDALVGHAAVAQRSMLVRGRALRCGYVEGVAVRADRRRRGYAGAMMAELERVIEAAYDFGALCASDEAVGFYRARGWRVWEGPTSVFAPDGIAPTPEEDGAVFMWPGAVAPDVTAPIACDWRDGDVW